MLGLLRQPLLKSVRIAHFGVKNVAQPIPRVLQRSYGRCPRCGCSGNLKGLEDTINCVLFGIGVTIITISGTNFYYGYIKDGPENKKFVQED